MKQLLTEFIINDDDYFEYVDVNELIKKVVGEDLYYKANVEFDIEFQNRDWHAQTQTIKIYIIGSYRHLMWFKLQFEPKKYSE
jgi:hypothetical protein